MNCRLFSLVLFAAASLAQAKLEPSQILLLTNANVPESLQLAQHYAEVRKIRPEHILPLDLPAADDISQLQYEAKVVAPIRKYLDSTAGDGIRCVVLFYGLPLRVGGSESTPADRAELAALRRLVAELDRTTAAIADALDAVAQPLGIAPVKVAGTEATRARVEATARLIDQAVAKIKPQQRQNIMTKLGDVRTRMTSVAQAAMETAFPGVSVKSDPAPASIQELAAKHRDATARGSLRQRVADFNGAFALYDIAQEQMQWINQDESDASLDSELANVLLDDYPRHRWQRNLLNYAFPGRPGRALMTCRIDAPTAEIARRIIDDSIAVEATGLDGRAVFDSRGIAPEPNGQPGSYGVYDQFIRDTARFFKDKTSIQILHDDRAQVLGPRAADNVALYCGWYSLRNYIPSCTFNRGAVAYHIASWEMISLHNPNEKGWVANLLKDNAAATLGAVSEPYLGSFPRPDEFFPLLLTGRFSLAEVYWATCPMSSWKIALIGDPMYRPYAKSPALKMQDLPPQLSAAVDKIEAAALPGR